MRLLVSTALSLGGIVADIESLVADLRAEQEAVDDVLAAGGADVFAVDTPAEGWKVQNQVAHLAYYDAAVTQAITDPDAFRATLSDRAADPDYVNTVAAPLVALPADELWDRWKSGRAAMYTAMLEADPKQRYPWYGPPMSIASACTARLMETWAHGQDISDALGVQRPASDRIAHVVFIGYRARPFAYTNRGLEVPEHDVLIDLELPSGERYTLGESRFNSIRGSALDFALLVTQRRHRDDTDLVASGPLADEFLDVAQAYAGPPGGGRQPGQFA